MPHPQTGDDAPHEGRTGFPRTREDGDICRGLLYAEGRMQGRPVRAVVEGGMLFLREPESGRPVRRLELARLRRLAGLPDGCWLVSEGEDDGLKLRLVWPVHASGPGWLRRVRKRGPSTRQWLLLAGLITVIVGTGLALALAPRHFVFLLSDRRQERLGALALQMLASGHRRCEAGERMLAAYLAVLRPASRLRTAPEIRLFRDERVNAFALPGNRVAVFTGLIDVTADRDALAGVLAHEIAHLERRDPTLALIRQQGIQLIVATLFQASMSIDTLVLMHFSRRSERAADRRAVAILRQAGFAADGLARFLERIAAREAMAENENENENEKGNEANALGALVTRVAQYWSTHPAPDGRARLLRGRIARGAEGPVGVIPPDLPAPARMRAACQNDDTSAR